MLSSCLSFLSFHSSALSVGSETFYASLARMQKRDREWLPLPPLATFFDSNGKRKRKFCAHAFSFSALKEEEEVGLGKARSAASSAWECYAGRTCGPLCPHKAG